MFFDTQKKENGDGIAREILEIAGLQRRLLLCRHDPRTRRPIPLKERKKGLFGREQVFPEGYEALCQELEEKKQRLTERLAAEGKPAGPYWWNLSWEELVPILLSDLTLPEEEDAPDEYGMRRAYRFSEVTEADGSRTLCVKVQVHRQGRASARRHTSDTVYSAYTAAERKKMEQAYTDRQNTRMLAHMAAANKVPVYSIASGRTYNTAGEYYMSEGLADNMRRAENYSQSLYTVTKTKHLSVSVESSDSEWLLGIARYHADDEGRLDYLEPLDFQVVSWGGDNEEAEGLRSIFDKKDAAVLCAWYLSYDGEVCQVPLELLNPLADQCAVSYEDARRQAEMITCLSEKMGGNV